MTRRAVSRAILGLLAPVCAFAGTTTGRILDHGGAAIAGAHVALFNAVGIVGEESTGANGEFRIEGPDAGLTKVVITADGFSTRTIALPAKDLVAVTMEIAPVTDSVRVAASLIDVPATEQPSSVSVISRADLAASNEAQPLDLLRMLPGVAVAQSGQRGGAASLFIRGGESTYNLVTLDGLPINSFTNGGGFDFSQVPSDFLDRVEVVRGAQSALYGSYANAGVVNFVTRSAELDPGIDVDAEGGSHDERRFAVSGAGLLHGFGIAASASHIEANGEVPNSDWRNQNLLLHLTRSWAHQNFSATGAFNSNEEGVPGPYGSDPAGLYTGLDLVSRDKNNIGQYGLRYQADITPRLRTELSAGFFLSNGFFASPYGSSFAKDIRGDAEARAVYSVSRYWTMAFGYAWGREEAKNTFITDSSYREFPLRRDDNGIYWENRIQFHRLSLQAGLRAEIFRQPLVPAFADPYTPRPEFPAHTYSRVNPKLAAAYMLTTSTRIHASVGTGIRPPGAFDLAYTTNPHLKPERTISMDAGIAQQFAGGRVVLDAGYFYNRYSDKIVSLGGSLAHLSSFTTDNLANARSRGAELSAQYKPARWMTMFTSYTHLDTAVLELDHSGGLAQDYFKVGQQLPRRPENSGSFGASASKGRVSGNIAGYVRGRTLDVEPNYGASAGFFNNPGYTNLTANLNVSLGHGATVYGALHNALNEHYEEIYGYPSPRLNFVSGIKWSFHGRDF